MADEILSSSPRRAGMGARPYRVEGLGARPGMPPEARARQAVSLRGEISPPPHKPWTLPAQGLAVFHGDADTPRLSHYFLPRVLVEGQRVLILDGANCADPRLLERLARQRGVPFAQFNRQTEIARAFTCFQLTELIVRVPRLLADFPAQVLIVTAFPDLYFDEDVRDWNARVAFERALAHLRRWAFSLATARSGGLQPGMAGATSAMPLLTVALFSAATTFTPSPARRRFFEKTCAAASEVWKFSFDDGGKLELACERTIVKAPSALSARDET